MEFGSIAEPPQDSPALQMCKQNECGVLEVAMVLRNDYVQNTEVRIGTKGVVDVASVYHSQRRYSLAAHISAQRRVPVKISQKPKAQTLTGNATDD